MYTSVKHSDARLKSVFLIFLCWNTVKTVLDCWEGEWFSSYAGENSCTEKKKICA